MYTEYIKKRTISNIISTGFLMLIPGLCGYLASPNNILDKMIATKCVMYPDNWIDYKEIAIFTSIFFTFLLLTFPLMLSQVKLNNLLLQKNKLLVFNQRTFINHLAKTYGIEYNNLNTSVFFPRKSIINTMKNLLPPKNQKKDCIKHYKIRNLIPMIPSNYKNGLTFKVNTLNPEGIIGYCVKKDAVVIDDDLKIGNIERYNLSSDIINRISHVKFSICAPVYKEKAINGNKVNVIAGAVLLNSTHPIKVILDKRKTDELAQAAWIYAQSLYDEVPELFRSNWRL